MLYAVDTGSRNTIFHPKLYFAANNEEAGVIIGSANLTFGGLHNNIEASSFMRLCLSNPTDKKFVDDATLAFADMLKEHPRHVFLIKDKTHAEELFESGRLADENVIPAPSVQSGVKKGERDDLPPMKLNRRNRPHLKTTVIKPVVIRAKPAIEETTIEVDQLRPAIATAKYLVWESKELTERDLNIPKAPDTNPTVSMGWKKGAFDDIDQRHYFREEVFSDLDWVTDPNRPIWERAQAKFDLVIKNLNYGAFDLKLSHNTDQTSKSYAQKNFMTQLHWGDAKEHVAKHDLLGRILYLYRKDTNTPEFTIEID